MPSLLPTQKGCSAVCEMGLLDKLPSCLSILILALAFINRCSDLCLQMKLPLNILIICQTFTLSVVRIALGVTRQSTGESKYAKKIARKLNKKLQVLVLKIHISQFS